MDIESLIIEKKNEGLRFYCLVALINCCGCFAINMYSTSLTEVRSVIWLNENGWFHFRCWTLCSFAWVSAFQETAKEHFVSTASYWICVRLCTKQFLKRDIEMNLRYRQTFLIINRFDTTFDTLSSEQCLHFCSPYLKRHSYRQIATGCRPRSQMYVHVSKRVTSLKYCKSLAVY